MVTPVLIDRHVGGDRQCPYRSESVAASRTCARGSRCGAVTRRERSGISVHARPDCPPRWLRVRDPRVSRAIRDARTGIDRVVAGAGGGGPRGGGPGGGGGGAGGGGGFGCAVGGGGVSPS